MAILSVAAPVENPLTPEVCQRAGRSMFAVLAHPWALLAERLVRRQTLRKLYRLDPHILRDIGFDPAEIYGAFEGTLGELHGDRWRGL